MRCADGPTADERRHQGEPGRLPPQHHHGLSGVAHGLADLSADDEIEHQAKILDRIAEDANEAATILER